jgi:hypothetical protein
MTPAPAFVHPTADTSGFATVTNRRERGIRADEPQRPRFDDGGDATMS